MTEVICWGKGEDPPASTVPSIKEQLAGPWQVFTWRNAEMRMAEETRESQSSVWVSWTEGTTQHPCAVL